MSTKVRCHCQSCAIRGLLWPAVLITIGILLLLDQLRGGPLDFENTFPVILVVGGLLLLASSLVSREGHIETTAPTGSQAPAPGNIPQAPFGGQGQP